MNIRPTSSPPWPRTDRSRAPSIAALIAGARTVLAPLSQSPALDAELLLAACLGQSRTYLYTWPEQVPSPTQQDCFAHRLAQRQNGVPIAYLLGEREFWGLSLRVGPGILIPRPETELLVALALERLPPDRPTAVLDLGTGSGAIALAIASERPLAKIDAIDCSPAAVQVALTNCRRLGLTRIKVHLGHWYAPVAGRRFDLIVANPPYLATDDPHLAQGDLRYEPRSALVAGTDGLAGLREVIVAASDHLVAGGHLLVEHGYTQGTAVVDLIQSVGLPRIDTHRDLAGQPRCVTASCP